MAKTVNAISDRLLGLVVPRVTAHAAPCTVVFCYCVAPRWAFSRCCAAGQCSGCYRTGIC
jgi:hypothetical protein